MRPSHINLHWLFLGECVEMRGQHPSYARYQTIQLRTPAQGPRQSWISWLFSAAAFSCSSLWLKLLYCSAKSVHNAVCAPVQNGEFDLCLCTFGVESPLIEHIQYSPSPPPDIPAGEWKSSVLNFCPAFFLPMTPFNRQWRNVCNSENSGTVPRPRLFAQLWVHFLQLWPLPWADTVTCIRWGACIKEEGIHMKHVSSPSGTRKSTRHHWFFHLWV